MILSGNLTSKAKLPPSNRSTHGSFHFFISQAVDERIQHGDHHRVEHRHHLVLASGVAGLGHHVNEGDTSIVESNGCEVGGAGGEGLVSSFSGGHLQDGDEDADVRETYDNPCDHDDGPRGDGRDKFKNRDI